MNSVPSYIVNHNYRGVDTSPTHGISSFPEFIHQPDLSWRAMVWVVVLRCFPKNQLTCFKWYSYFLRYPRDAMLFSYFTGNPASPYLDAWNPHKQWDVYHRPPLVIQISEPSTVCFGQIRNCLVVTGTLFHEFHHPNWLSVIYFSER